MAPSKLISSFKIAICSILLFFSCEALADYMVDYGPSPEACNTCYQSQPYYQPPCKHCQRVYHHRAHYARPAYPHYVHRIHRASSCKLEVIYTTDGSPDYYNDLSNRCRTYHTYYERCPNNRCMTRRVTYATYPVREINTCAACQSCRQGISYDRATADDAYEY